MPDTRELNAGDQVGRYVIVRPLGRGGMGVVYVARDERLGRDVAWKMIAGLADDTARSRFWREARAAASVNHPNICQVFEVDEADNVIFLTMELLGRRVDGSAAHQGRDHAAGCRADRDRHAWRPRCAACARLRASRHQALERVPDAARAQAA